MFGGGWADHRTTRPAPGPDRRGVDTEHLTFGVEEEFLLVDAATGALVPRSRHVLPHARAALGDVVTSELNQCQIEVDTPVYTRLTDVQAELVRLRRQLNAAAELGGSRIAASATHPFSSWRDQRVDAGKERYARLEDDYQLVAREQVICGCHVHVGISDPDLAIATMNRARPWLPVLLALSANSPYWEGGDTGYASYRLQVWRRWPTAGMPPELSGRAQYDALVAELVEVGAIEDASFLYWYVRPSARFSTLEFRACDVCLGVEATVAVAGLVRALAWTSALAAVRGEPQPPVWRDVLDAAMWRAGRYGLQASLVDPTCWRTRRAAEVVEALLDHVRVGLEAHGDWSLVRPLVHRILARGNGATRQRLAFGRRREPGDVVGLVLEETLAGA